MIIFKGMVEQAKVRAELKHLNEQLEVYRRCGLDKERKKLLPKYNSLVAEIRRLDEDIEAQRRKSAHALLVCFVAADLATLAADQFGDVCKEVNFGGTSADNEFIKLMKFNADVSAKRWNEVVQLIDEGSQNEKLGCFYADFSEKITDTVLPIINNAVEEVMNTKQGQRML